MKKILVLMLVLGMASMASAALTLSGPANAVTGTTVTFTLSADAESAAGGDYGYVYAGGFSNVTMLPAMSDGDMSGTNYTAGTYTYFYFVGADSPSDITAPFLAAGDWLTFDMTAGAVGTSIDVSVVSFSGFDGDSLSISVIPEPMTIGLLGLGGLFLRRRK